MENLSDIIKLLSSKNVSIFFGAGISYNSGLPLANELLRNIFKRLGLTDNEINIILNSKHPFEAIMEIFKIESDISQILEIFKLGSPNNNHLLIANLIKLGYIKNVMTTNFDCLIEKALEIVGLVENKDFHVYSNEDDFAKIDYLSNKIKIIKIHGSITNYTEICISLDNVASKNNCIYKNKTIESFFNKNINKNVFVLGYSCSDYFDINPVLESLKNKCNICFFNHILENSGINIEKIHKINYPFLFSNYKGYIITTNTDYIIKLIWEYFLNVNYYQIHDYSKVWKKYVKRWLSKLEKEDGDGIKFIIIAKLFYDIQYFDLSIKFNQLCLKLNNNTQVYSTALATLAMCYNNVGKYYEAVGIFRRALKLSEKINNIQGLISQLGNLGNAYRNLFQYTESIKCFKEAISIAGKYNYEKSLCSLYGNYARLLNEMNNPHKAIVYAKKGLELAKAYGIVQNEMSLVSTIGISYIEMDRLDDAKKFFEESKNIARKLGSRDGECSYMINTAYILMKNNKIDLAKNFGNKAYELALEIKNAKLIEIARNLNIQLMKYS